MTYTKVSNYGFLSLYMDFSGFYPTVTFNFWINPCIQLISDFEIYAIKNLLCYYSFTYPKKYVQK